MGDWLHDEHRDAATTRILDAAGERFLRSGIAATTMSDIATSAGCSRATVYNHFPNRRALHLAFVNRAAERIGTRVRARTSRVADPAQRLTETIVGSLEEVRADPTLSAWFSGSDVGLAIELSQISDAVPGLAGDQSAIGGDPAVNDWVVRNIVSLLSMPTADAATERAIIERFVVPPAVAAVLARAATGE